MSGWEGGWELDRKDMRLKLGKEHLGGPGMPATELRVCPPGQGQQTFSVKGQVVMILGSVTQFSDPVTPPYCGATKADVGDTCKLGLTGFQ